MPAWLIDMAVHGMLDECSGGFLSRMLTLRVDHVQAHGKHI